MEAADAGGGGAYQIGTSVSFDYSLGSKILGGKIIEIPQNLFEISYPAIFVNNYNGFSYPGSDDLVVINAAWNTDKKCIALTFIKDGAIVNYNAVP